MEKLDDSANPENAESPDRARCFSHGFPANSHTAFHQGSCPYKTAPPAQSSSRSKRPPPLDRKPGLLSLPLRSCRGEPSCGHIRRRSLIVHCHRESGFQLRSPYENQMVYPPLTPVFPWESAPNLLGCTDQLESSPLHQESCSSHHPTN